MISWIRTRLRSAGRFLAVWLSSAWGWIGTYKDQIQICSLVVVAIWALVQYDEAKDRWRIERSLGYGKEYREGRISEARIKIDKFWMTLKDPEWRKAKAKNDVGRQFELADSYVVKHSHHNDLVSLQTFYKDLSVCALTNYCDYQTNCTMFFEEVRNFRDTYINYLTRWSDLLGFNVLKEIDEFMVGCMNAERK
jgi:hypothetical protein